MAQDKHWNYNPSVPAAVVVTVIFAALTIFHVFRLFRTRTWFCLPLIIGGICEFTFTDTVKILAKISL